MKKETIGEVTRNALKEIRDAIFDSISFDNKSEVPEHLKYAMMEKPPKRKRARTKDGTYKADDKSTPDINEAWENE